MHSALFAYLGNKEEFDKVEKFGKKWKLMCAFILKLLLIVVKTNPAGPKPNIWKKWKLMCALFSKIITHRRETQIRDQSVKHFSQTNLDRDQR